MILVQDALRRILQEVPSVPVESIGLDTALGRVLAEDVSASMSLPRWNNSAMDGYAVRASDTREGEVTLRLTEVVGAGHMPKSPVPAGFACGLMTGAPLPDGADAVVMVENTDASRRDKVVVRGLATVGQNIRRKGEDVQKGAIIIQSGTQLCPGHLALLASQGLTSVMVSRKPVVAILTTGDEVVEPGRPLGPGQIYSSNAVLLKAMVDDAGGDGVYAGNAMDDPHSVATRLQWCVAEADIVVTSGGVGAGAFDPVKRAFDLIGARVDFWKVAMQPGKPLAFGVVEMTGRRTPLLGLPGNPTSAAVSCLQFVRPMVRAAMGIRRPVMAVLTAISADDIKVRPGRSKFVRVMVESTDSGLVARLAGMQSSGMVSTFARANALLHLPSDSEGVKAGARVKIQLFDPSCLDRSDLGLMA